MLERMSLTLTPRVAGEVHKHPLPRFLAQGAGGHCGHLLEHEMQPPEECQVKWGSGWVQSQLLIGIRRLISPRNPLHNN